MSFLEIALILIGIIVIVISCIMIDRSQKPTINEGGRPVPQENSLSEEDKIQLKKKLDELLSDVSEEVIVHTDDTLSKISNEKIMAVSEFSDQILEKINRNHDEVIFLYNMLNDKEKELKSAVREIDTSKKKVQDILDSKEKNPNSHTTKEKKAPTSSKPVTQAAQIEKSIKELTKVSSEEETPTNSISINSNSQILTLYSQGKSVIEISKLLGLGQGEVKLVIDLFKGKK